MRHRYSYLLHEQVSRNECQYAPERSFLISIDVEFDPIFFVFQAKDGIRAPLVTGVQTCALPISARVGDTAVITAGGEYHGWVGGGCTRSTVLREALRAIADGEPRLLSLSPEPGEEGRRAGR